MDDDETIVPPPAKWTPPPLPALHEIVPDTAAIMVTDAKAYLAALASISEQIEKKATFFFTVTVGLASSMAGIFVAKIGDRHHYPLAITALVLVLVLSYVSTRFLRALAPSEVAPTGVQPEVWYDKERLLLGGIDAMIFQADLAQHTIRFNEQRCQQKVRAITDGLNTFLYLPAFAAFLYGVLELMF